MEQVLQFTFYLAYDSLANKFDFIYNEEENVSFLYALYRYTIFIMTNIVALSIDFYLQTAFTSICYLIINLKPYYARIFYEIFLIILHPLFLSIIVDIFDNNLNLIRLAQFFSLLFKIIIYIDIFNNFLFKKYASSVGIPLDHRFAKKLSARDIFIRIGLFSVYSIFTYHFQFFLFNWLSIDALSIFFFDLITDENFQQKLHKVNNE